MGWASSFLLALIGFKKHLQCIHRFSPFLWQSLTILKWINSFCFFIRLLEVATPFIFRRAQLSRLASSGPPYRESTDSRLIKSFSLLALGMWLSTLSSLNFSLGFFVGALCSPLAFLKPIMSPTKHQIWIIISAVLVMQLISPLNWFYLIARLEFGESVSKLARLYRFAWKVWGAWTPLVWWCIWWPAYLAGLVVLASPM